MERLILQQLTEWKNREGRKPLIINGARQVGKTWALREFAKREYAKELGAMVKTEPKQVLINNQIFTEYKGGMTEEYVLQEMKSLGIEPIYYHKTDDSRLELDFVIQHNANILPIEVKAEGNVKVNSLTNLLKANPELKAVRLSMLPYKEQEQLTCIPLYAITALKSTEG